MTRSRPRQVAWRHDREGLRARQRRAPGDVHQGRAHGRARPALPPRRAGHARALPRQDAPDRSRARLHRVLVGAARRRDLVQPRHPPGVDDDGAADPRHHRGDRPPARALRPGEDLPAGALLGQLPRHPGGGAGAGAVPRVHRHGPGRPSAEVRGARLRVRAGPVPEGRGREDGAQAGGGAGHHGRAAPSRLHEGARRGHAPPRRRDDPRHAVRGHGRVRARVADARLHGAGEDRRRTRQGVLPGRHVGRLPGDGPHRRGDGAESSPSTSATGATTTPAATPSRGRTSGS